MSPRLRSSPGSPPARSGTSAREASSCAGCRAACRVLGGRTTVRWLGSTAVEMVTERRKAPFRSRHAGHLPRAARPAVVADFASPRTARHAHHSRRAAPSPGGRTRGARPRELVRARRAAARAARMAGARGEHRGVSLRKHARRWSAPTPDRALRAGRSEPGWRSAALRAPHRTALPASRPASRSRPPAREFFEAVHALSELALG